MDEFGQPKLWLKVTVMFGSILLTAGICVIFTHWLGYGFVKNQEQVRWLDTPVTTERNAQGQPVSAIVFGFDEHGYVRWGRAPVPAPAPALAPVIQPPAAAPAQPIKPALVKPASGK